MRVDPYIASLKAARDRERASDVLCPHRRPQTVADAVRETYRLVFTLNRKDDEHVTKDLLAR